jgi:hypothetical protein
MSRAAWQISSDLETARRVRGQERRSDFLRLANTFSALYPKGSEEKRLIDAMLLAVPR